MAKAQKIRVDLPERLKAGGKIYPAGKCLMPLDLVEALEDEQDDLDHGLVKRIEGEDPIADPDQIAGLDVDQLATARRVMADLSDDALKDGVPKVGALNDALKAAAAGFALNGQQIAAIVASATPTPEQAGQ